MNPWTVAAVLAWPAAALAAAIIIGRSIHLADQRDRRYHTPAARARIADRYPTVVLDGRVPHHIAVHVIRQVQHEQVEL